MAIILKNSAGAQGHEKMVIQTSDPSGGHLRLFPGTNQVVLASVGVPASSLFTYEMYKSTDSGDSFDILPSDFPQIYKDSVNNAAVSFNNRYYYIGDPSTIDGSAYIAQSKDFGNSWEYKIMGLVDSRRFQSVSSSRDGKYVLGANGAYNDNGDVVLSQDFGETWSYPIVPQYYFRTFVDPTGQNMLVGGFTTTKYSNDYGDTWSNFSQPMNALGGAMISGDGNYKVVFEQYNGSGSRVYISTDWTNWTSNTLTVRLIGGSISNDGKYMLIASGDGYNSADQYLNLSTDYGQTWTKIDLGLGNQLWTGTTMSSDGKYMMITPGFGDTGPVMKSVDYGETWGIETAIPSGIYYQISMSASGRYGYISGPSRGLYVSRDYLNTWTHVFDSSTCGGTFINF